MHLLNLSLAVFGGVVLLLNVFSKTLSSWSLPAPVLALVTGFVTGPYVLGIVRLGDFGGHAVLEQVVRLTLAVGLVGVAQRMPTGYWRRHWRWVLASIVFGMAIMFAFAGLVLWLLLGLPLLFAVLIGAIMTPTDPIVTTPIVTGSQARRFVPDSVRLDMSSESGLNDGLGYPFVFAPILLLTKPPGEAWSTLFLSTLGLEVLGAIVVGGGVGFLVAALFDVAQRYGMTEKTSKLGFFLPFALLTVGALKLIGTDGVLAVFVAAAVFGQRVSNEAEREQGELDDAVNRFFSMPAFLLLGMALPITGWFALGLPTVGVLLLALLGRRIVAIWLLRPFFARRHDVPQTVFLSWFGPIGVSALYYTLVAERRTGDAHVFTVATLVITLSVLLHGLSSVPWSRWIARRSDVPAHDELVAGGRRHGGAAA